MPTVRAFWVLPTVAGHQSQTKARGLRGLQPASLRKSFLSSGRCPGLGLDFLCLFLFLLGLWAQNFR